MKFIKQSILLISLLFIGCGYSSHFVDDAGSTYPASNPDDIEIYSGDIEADYEVIGVIASDVVGDGEKATKRALSEASKIGADAIIFVKLTKLNSFAQRTGLSGVAIKLK
jgi:hypothetical protein